MLRARIGALRREARVGTQGGEQIGQFNHAIAIAGCNIAGRTKGFVVVSVEDAENIYNIEEAVGVYVAESDSDGPAGALTGETCVVYGAAVAVVAGGSVGQRIEVAVSGHTGIGGARVSVITIGVDGAIRGKGSRGLTGCLRWNECSRADEVGFARAWGLRGLIHG
jgi:hypothetical protein